MEVEGRGALTITLKAAYALSFLLLLALHFSAEPFRLYATGLGNLLLVTLSLNLAAIRWPSVPAL